MSQPPEDVTPPQTTTITVPYPPRPRMTSRQLELLRFIRDYREKHLISPSVDEMADELKISRPSTWSKVNALTGRGYLFRLVGVHRSIQLTDPALQLLAYFESQGTKVKDEIVSEGRD